MSDDKGNVHLDTMADSMSREANDRARSRDRTTRGDTADERADAAEVGMGPAGEAGGIVLGVAGGIVGALAGALGGWWNDADREEEKTRYTEADDRRYRAHYEREPGTAAPGDRRFDDFRAGYWLGHVARRNPLYAGRRFEEIEPELRRGWSEEMRERYGDWAGMRGYVRAAYQGDIRDPDELPPGEKRRDIIAAIRDPLPPGEIRE